MDICGLQIGDKAPLVLIAGPCVIESYESCLTVGGKLKKIADSLKVPYIFKASYDKANRTSINSYRGPGIEKGIDILNSIKNELQVPVLSDVHSVNEVDKVAGTLDIIQVPAFLCRQTDLLVAAAETGKPVNVKKGQFLAPADMSYAADKISSTGNKKIIFTERGTTFGYNNIVSDMRSILIMKNIGFPVIFDATHSVQLPGGQGCVSGGNSSFAAPLAKAAVAAGCDGLFLEVHEYPEKALSDSSTMLNINEIESLLQQAVKIHSAVTEC